jgi:nitrite reductase/ring-hydroxylating ferredoxin subunit
MKRDLSETIKDVLSDEQKVRTVVATTQADFPYDRDDEAEVTRREFCSFLFLTSSALLVGSAAFAGKYAYQAQNMVSFPTAKIEGAETLQPGNALNFHYPGETDPAILIRTNDGAYYAYDQKCTHLTCPVYFAKERERLECPCHEGGFDVMTGNVLYGPPPRPLDKIEIEVRGEEVWAVGVRKASENEHY